MWYVICCCGIQVDIHRHGVNKGERNSQCRRHGADSPHPTTLNEWLEGEIWFRRLAVGHLQGERDRIRLTGAFQCLYSQSPCAQGALGSEKEKADSVAGGWRMANLICLVKCPYCCSRRGRRPGEEPHQATRRTKKDKIFVAQIKHVFPAVSCFTHVIVRTQQNQGSDVESLFSCILP